MAHEIKILAFAGSTRTDSYNKKLVKTATKGATEAGAQVTFIDLREYPMPLFDEDLESTKGLDPNAKKFRELLKNHNGFLISSPEYNGSLSGVLKNAIDWASRPVDGEKPLECFSGKVVGLLSASPGSLGGIRGLAHLRAILSQLQCLVLPEQFALSFADSAFKDDVLADPKKEASAKKIGALVYGVARKLKA